MAFCSKCGVKLEDSARFCPSCGQPVYNEQNKEKGEGGQSGNAVFDTPDITNEFSSDDIEKNKGMAIISYISILCLIPLFASKDSEFAQFHAKQGFNLFILEAIWCVANIIITTIMYAINGVVGYMFSTILSLIWIAPVVLSIIGIINAANGQAKELPIVGGIKIFK